MNSKRNEIRRWIDLSCQPRSHWRSLWLFPAGFCDMRALVQRHNFCDKQRKLAGAGNDRFDVYCDRYRQPDPAADPGWHIGHPLHEVLYSRPTALDARLGDYRCRGCDRCHRCMVRIAAMRDRSISQMRSRANERARADKDELRARTSAPVLGKVHNSHGFLLRNAYYSHIFVLHEATKESHLLAPGSVRCWGAWNGNGGSLSAEALSSCADTFRPRNFRRPISACGPTLRKPKNNFVVLAGRKGLSVVVQAVEEAPVPSSQAPDCSHRNAPRARVRGCTGHEV